MDRRLAGLVVLLAAVVALIIVPQALRPGIDGQASAAPLPEPPALGSCVDIQRRTATVVDCTQPHDGEITARWLAEDPLSPWFPVSPPPGVPTSTNPPTCVTAATEYLGDIPGTLQGWTLSVLDVRSLLVRAPRSERVGQLGWTACVLQSPYQEPYVGALRDLPDLTARPGVFGVCVADLRAAVSCSSPHNTEQLGTLTGTWTAIIPGGERLALRGVEFDLQNRCEQLARQLTGSDDPTYGGQLTVGVQALQPTPSRPHSSGTFSVDYVATCRLQAGASILAGSIVGLGDAPLPLS